MARYSGLPSSTGNWPEWWRPRPTISPRTPRYAASRAGAQASSSGSPRRRGTVAAVSAARSWPPPWKSSGCGAPITPTYAAARTTGCRRRDSGGSSGSILPGVLGRWRLSKHVQAVSRREARQMAVASQLLADDQAASSPLDVLGHLGAIQLDAMQRVDKSHRLVCFARTEFPGGRETIDEYFWVQAGEATAFEAWAHAVSLIPVDDWPLWGFRRQSTRSVTWAPQAGLSDRLVGVVTDAGPQTIRGPGGGG